MRARGARDFTLCRIVLYSVLSTKMIVTKYENSTINTQTIRLLLVKAGNDSSIHNVYVKKKWSTARQ